MAVCVYLRLHQTGTSLLGRNIARLENCACFKESGVIEDDDQFLQDVSPMAESYCGAGKFGFDPRARLTETSPPANSGQRANRGKAGNDIGIKATLFAWKRLRVIC
jgi:hypothetical protein